MSNEEDQKLKILTLLQKLNEVIEKESPDLSAALPALGQLYCEVAVKIYLQTMDSEILEYATTKISDLLYKMAIHFDPELT